MTRVKICGVTTPEDARLAAESGAWAVGLVFAPGSPRRVAPDQARRIAAALPSEVLRVGVFVDPDMDDIKAAEGLDLIQLHGKETDEFARAVGAERVIRAVLLSDAAAAADAARREGAYLLADRPRRPDAPPVDLGLARSLVELRPITVLAGGLTPENAGAAVRAVRPFGVDVSSGVESAPGVKDPAKLKSFFAAVRRADEEAA